MDDQEKTVIEKEKVNGSDSSSNESLYEIRLNELVKRNEISDFDLRALVVRCSSCGRQINHYSYKEIKKHRKLGVITCKECYEFYGSSEFSQDESGYNYCTWCGNGGKLIICDYCPNGFCSACIRRNFGRAEISVTTKEGWKCYVCDKVRLNPKMKFCDLIMTTKQKSFKKEKKPVPKDPSIPERWLQFAFVKCDEASKTFNKKMIKLKSIGVYKKKSLKHIVKKLEEIVDNHKTELKNIVGDMMKDYDKHVEQQRIVAQESNDVAITTVLETSKNEDSNSDCIIVNDVGNKEQVNGEAENVQNKDKENAHIKDKEEKLQAKLLLLKSSSESDSDENAQTNSKEMGNSTLCNETTVEEISESISTATKDPSAEKDPDTNTLSNKVDKKMNLVFSDSSDNEHNFDKIIEEVGKHLDDENFENSETEYTEEKVDPYSDPKLTLQSKVELIRCDSILEDGKVSVIISDGSDQEKKLDKLVDSLCKFPRNVRTKRVPKGKRSSGPPRSCKQLLMESSSSISLSSEEDEDQKKITIEKKRPTKAKSPLKNAGSDESSSNDSPSSSDSEDEKKSKKSKKSCAKSDSSSNDFKPVRKRKYDKLLHGPLLSDSGDDDGEKKPKGKKEKKVPRKRKIRSSEEEKKSSRASSATSSSDESSGGKKQPKKRRRIKKVGSSSDDDQREGDEKDTPGKGRKNIKKIISQKNLAMSTKEAQAEEKERKKRIQERQKLYNKIEDFSIDGNEIITRKMVLEVDQDSKAEIVEIHPDLVCKLKPHQVNGVKFMWECTIESVKDLDKPGSGCILAHCMGLGKTLQVIAFMHTCLNNPIVGKKIRRGMVICPYNTALNWVSEFDYWLESVEGDITVHQLSSCKTNFERLDILRYWFEDGGVLIVSYNMFRQLANGKVPKLKKKNTEELHKYLLDPGPDIVVCDEGHILKNEKSAISVATNKLATARRIVLTGTPLQNNLKEYHCMLSFVKPNLLGTAIEFRNRFVHPIINGQYDDSNDYDVKLMKKRIHILHKLLDGCVQRCDYAALTKFLPPKHEFVISVKLSEVQMKMYECYLENLTSAKQDAKICGRSLFVDFNNLRCIWTHPYICHVSFKRAEIRKLFKDDDEEDETFINDESLSEASTKSSETTSDEDHLLMKIDMDKRSYKTRSRKGNDDEEEEESEKEDTEKKQWYHEFITEADKYNLELSGKMVLLMEILKECERIGDKILLFSQSLLALDIIEDLLSYSSTQTSKGDDKDIKGTWIRGLDYFRMDGTTSVDFRKNYIDMFNDPNNERARLFLISTRAGSLGTNLVGANRVIIFDTSWNPSHDVQAIFRVYRFGQIKPVYIYRLLAQGTMEEKIYDRQVTKLSLSCRVVDEQQIDRHFSASDLAELYTFDRNSIKQRPTPMVPRDRLLAEMLIKNAEWIVTYHEHDSLLQNQTEEDLTEEERQAAWQEYENEKEGQPSTSSFTGINNFDSSTLTNEPDFTQDYDGRKIPDLKDIVNCLCERIKVESPEVCTNQLEFKKKVLASVFAVRQAFQEKHVKILRMKQEFCSRGTVPVSINKYMDELAQILKSTGDYITRLSAAITTEQMKAKVQQAFQRGQQQPQANMYGQQMPTAARGAAPFIVIRGRMPANFQQTFQNYPRFNYPPRNTFAAAQNMNNVKSFSTYSRNQDPVISEIDDTSTNPNSNSSTPAASTAKNVSTVTIEEIT